MGKTLAETISDHTRTHLLERNGVLLSQCVRAVGNIGGTVPELTEEDGIIELPTCDSAGPGFAVGCALAGRRPIFVARYQGFMWYNAATLINYAAKSKEIWNQPCPVFIRSIGMERNGIGPVASSCQHSMVMRMPGMPVCAPMTPNEWTQVWNWYLEHDDPVYVSEHRRSFVIDYEMENILGPDPDVTIIAISAGRLNAIEAAKKLEALGIKTNIVHTLWLKPYVPTNEILNSIASSKMTVVVDSDFEICGASRSIAYELNILTDKKVYALGLQDRTCGVALHTENCTPTDDEIVRFIQEKLK